MSPPQSQSSANSDFDHQGQVIGTPYATESHLDKELNYDYLGHGLTTEQTMNTSAYTMQSDERDMLHRQPSSIVDLSYHGFLARVEDQFSIHSDNSNAVSASSAASLYPSEVPDIYHYAKDPSLLFRSETFDATAGYPAWGASASLPPSLQDAAPEFSSAGFSTTYAGYSDSHLPPTMNAGGGAPASSVASLEHMSPPPTSTSTTVGNAPYTGGDAFHGAPLYGLPDAARETAYTASASVPDPGARFGDYPFFR